MDNFEVTYYFRQENVDLWVKMLCEVLNEIHLNLDDGCAVKVNIVVKECD